MKKVMLIIFALVLVAITGCVKQGYVSDSYQVNDNQVNVTANNAVVDNAVVKVDVNSESAVPDMENVVLGEVKTDEVVIQNDKFNPSVLYIGQGTTVLWVNRDNNDHVLSFENFESYVLTPNAEFAYTFDEKGVYEYQSKAKPEMKGVIVVQ